MSRLASLARAGVLHPEAVTATVGGARFEPAAANTELIWVDVSNAAATPFAESKTTAGVAPVAACAAAPQAPATPVRRAVATVVFSVQTAAASPLAPTAS